MKRRMLLLTGNPGVGKTTLLLKIIESLRKNGFTVGGMVSQEIRKNGIRVGFEITSLIDNRRGWLARVDEGSGPQVSRYKVVLADLDRVGARAIIDAIEAADVVAIDEIGPMELCSEKFKMAVNRAVRSDKPVVGIVHRNARNPMIESLKEREDVHIMTVTRENRNGLEDVFVREAIAFLRKQRLD